MLMLTKIQVVLLLASVLAAGGCSTAPPLRCDGATVDGAGEEEDFGRFAGLPRGRVGCLPFYGPFTLLAVADPSRLGEHRYAGLIGSEIERGILYTTRAGFIDLAHLRKAADLTAYFAARFEVALDEGWPCIQMRSREPSVYRIELTYSADWDDLPPEVKEPMVRELAIRLGQQLAVESLLWHEVITWFGYKATFILPEDQSAFAYDDPPSHIIGAIVAGEALRMRDVSYDEAVTQAIERHLIRLGAVDPDQTERAIRAVDGHWWRDGTTRRRMFQANVDEPIAPWTVEEPSDGEMLEPLVLPSLCDVNGRDCTGIMRVTIDPLILEADAIRSVLPERPELIGTDRDVPVLLAHIREKWLAEEGPDADCPHRRDNRSAALSTRDATSAARPRTIRSPAPTAGGAPIAGRSAAREGRPSHR